MRAPRDRGIELTLTCVIGACVIGPGQAGCGGDGGGAPDLAEVMLTVPVLERVRINSHPDQPNFQAATAPVELRGTYAAAKLVVDLDTTCYPFTKWRQNPPPEGQNWPADCDAFDRNFELSLDDPMKEGERPGIELVRAITPFGGPMHLEVDITDVANGIAPGNHRLRVTIPTWSDGAGKVSGSNGGWLVSARLELVTGAPPRKVRALVPIFYGNQSNASGPGALRFEVPAGVGAGRLEWRATGHGGGARDADCIGPAEEFCRRKHTLRIDGMTVFEDHLWRDDCELGCDLDHYGPPTGGFDYCKQNPCGNIDSVQAPRANWCPGSVTRAVVIEDARLGAAGAHTLDWSIVRFGTGGMWRLSALYVGYE